MRATVVAVALGIALAAGCDGCSRKADPAAADAAAPVSARSPTEIRRDGNHLVGQASLYLKEHAHNPVDWHPWGPEALALAKALDRPIFLSIGYASCHWCHVMAKEVFEDDAIAAQMNREVVAIKVDREERPDVDATYMDALNLLSGSGGWPASLFLTPDLVPFFGATYVPKEKFGELVASVVKEYREARGKVDERGKSVQAKIAEWQQSTPGDGHARIRPGEIEALAKMNLDAFDPRSGGFRGAMRFPNPGRWTFLLHAARKWGEPFLAPVRKTLDAMASGGLFDHVGGGFFRYTVDATWTVPHFEKMLYVNAALASLYLEAYAAFGVPRDLEVARETLDFLLREMHAPEGGFFASLDADSGGEEGSFYVFRASEIRELFGAEGASTAALVGATDAGNFHGGTTVVYRTEAASKMDPRRWVAIRGKLAAVREKRTRPTRDEKIVTAWNGITIAAFARGYEATGDERYRAAATEGARFLWDKHRRGAVVVRTSTGGTLGEPGSLDDYAALAFGFVALARATSEPIHIERAIALVGYLEGAFAHPAGGWYTSPPGGPLERRQDLVDSEEPSGSALAITTLVHLAALTGKPDLTSRLDRTLGVLGPALRASRTNLSALLDAALVESGPFYDVVIAGATSAPDTLALGRGFRGLAPAWASLVTIDPGGPAEPIRLLLPPSEGKTAKAGRATAYVCVRGACKEPTPDPAKLKSQLLDGWTR